MIAYTLGLTDSTAGTPETLIPLSSSAMDYTFTGLNSGSKYLIRIKATNLVGDSEWSQQITAYAGIEPTRPGLITFVSSNRNSLLL